jgi:uncharacterized lipoprotein YmbA
MRIRSAALVIALFSGAVGCASLPPRKIYLLNGASEAATEVSAAGAAPSLRLDRVLVPDYLDTTDILTRAGAHELQSSQSGRWGERLSLGITHALRADLAVLMPAGGVVTTQPSGSGVRRLLVTVETFDVWADGHCILTANWTLLEKDGRDAVSTGRGAFTTPAAGGGIAGDAAVIAAMANAVSQLADSIASTVKRL